MLCLSVDLGWVGSEKNDWEQCRLLFLTGKKLREITCYCLKDWLGLPQGMVELSFYIFYSIFYVST